jgi:ATP-dependent helicase HrpA
MPDTNTEITSKLDKLFSDLYLDSELCMYNDRIRFQLKARKIRSMPPEQQLEALKKLSSEVMLAKQKLIKRQAQKLYINYPEQLPVSQRAEDIVSAIKSNQVVIVAGETGSGKTTQLPKICLQAGLGCKGLIGHTQPRRLAARAVSQRIAEEMKVELGGVVGYQVRFTDQASDETLIKVMTDGILLAEIKRDRYLNKYDAIIIDEAHERSLNIDFLLGYLKRLLVKRPELKLIITSATIDVDRFSNYFANAPIFSVTGRSFPVDVYYRPAIQEEGDGANGGMSLISQITDTIEEIYLEERKRSWGIGDVLIFLPGEREIREISIQLKHENWRDTEILPLYARLGNKDQNRVFQSHAGRRIVLATNVAETSITVPGIRYVIDPGTVRMSRYSVRSKIQRLPIEAISQASANQRKGRCGRVANGICYRLYSEDDFLNRTEFTDPEILRTNLAAVILKMMDSGIGEVSQFEFIDPPDNRLWSDGYKLLHELEAVDQKRKITKSGRQLAALPADPRLAKMLLSAATNGSLKEVLIIVSGLSIQDPRERPSDKQQAADQAHAPFKDPESDFMAFLNLWNIYEEERQNLSSNQLKRYCLKNYLSFMRMREWREIHRQLHLVLKEMKFTENKQEANYDSIHQALLSGMLGHVGRHEEKREYHGCRNRKFNLFPGSSLNKKRPKWVFSAEIVEIQQVYARNNAKIDPAWIEPLAPHLIKKSWSEPVWKSKRAQVIANEKVTLYGLEIISNRPVNFSKIDPIICRDIFIRSGLVDGEYKNNIGPIRKNRELIQKLEEMEDRTRRRDMLVDDETVYDLYQQIIPGHIVSGASFEKWFKKLSDLEKNKLSFTKQDLLRGNAPEFDASLYPNQIETNGIRLPLSYQFNPGAEEDGVTISVPVNAIRQLTASRLEKLVPGLLREKCIHLIKNLPRTLRRNFVPVPDVVDSILPRIESSSDSLLDALTLELKRKTLVSVPYEAWNLDLLENHLRFNIQIVDNSGKVIEQGRDLLSVVDKVEHLIENTPVNTNQQSVANQKITAWDFEQLDSEIVVVQAGIEMLMYPALKDCGTYVEKILCSNDLQAKQITNFGIARLLSYKLAPQIELFKKEVKHYKEMALLYAPVGQAKRLYDDFLISAITQHFIDKNLSIYTKNDFEAIFEAGRSDFVIYVSEYASLVFSILEKYHLLMKKLKGKVNLSVAIPMSDLQNQVGNLIYDGFLSSTPILYLQRIPFYLEACFLRLEKMPREMANERRYVPLLREWWDSYQDRKKKLEAQGIWDDELLRFRWMIEELRISWYAQNVKTAEPVSEKRLNKQWELVCRA